MHREAEGDTELVGTAMAHYPTLTQDFRFQRHLFGTRLSFALQQLIGIPRLLLRRTFNRGRSTL
jgi:hypothetical protein